MCQYIGLLAFLLQQAATRRGAAVSITITQTSESDQQRQEIFNFTNRLYEEMLRWLTF